MSTQFDKISQLNFNGLSIEDLSALKSGVLRDTLIEISELDDNEYQLQSHQDHASHSSHTTHQNSANPPGVPPIG